MSTLIPIPKTPHIKSVRIKKSLAVSKIHFSLVSHSSPCVYNTYVYFSWESQNSIHEHGIIFFSLRSLSFYLQWIQFIILLKALLIAKQNINIFFARHIQSLSSSSVKWENNFFFSLLFVQLFLLLLSFTILWMLYSSLVLMRCMHIFYLWWDKYLCDCVSNNNNNMMKNVCTEWSVKSK